MPSARGWGVLAGSVVLYVFAVLLHYRTVGLLATAGILATAVGFAWVARKPNIVVDRSIEPTRVVRGDMSLARLSVTNRGRLSVSRIVGVEPCGEQVIHVEVPRLLPGAKHRSTYALPTNQRGVFDVGPLMVSRQDPLGLWRRAQRLGPVERIYVYPKVHPLHSFPVGRTLSLDGPERDALMHGSITFHALREYVPGDDLRHVHWRSTARTGTLMVRDHVDTSLPQVTLILDTNADSFDSESFEEAVDVTASLIAEAVEARVPVHLVTADGRSVQGRGIAADLEPMFELLTMVSTSPRSHLRGLVNSLMANRRGDVLLAVMGAAAPENMSAVAALGSHYNRGIVTIVSKSSASVELGASGRLSVCRVDDAESFPPAWRSVTR